MIRSMTGFGQGAAESDRYRVRATLRGVKHRFLDLALRLRDEQRLSESALRDLFTERLARGRVDVNVDVEPLGTPPHRLEVDLEALHELTRVLDGLVEEQVLERGLTAGDLLRLPQIVQVSEEERGWTEADQELLLRVAGTALDELIGARTAEGAKLRAALEERLEGLEAATVELRAVIPRARPGGRRGARAAAPGRPGRARARRPAPRPGAGDPGGQERRRRRDRSPGGPPRALPGGPRRGGRRRQAARLPDPGDLPRAQHPRSEGTQQRHHPRGPRRQGPLRAAPRAGPERGVGTAPSMVDSPV